MVSSTSPLETEFTLVIDVSKGIWSKFTSANYASALIEAAAGTTDFITGWQKTKIDLTPFPHVPATETSSGVVSFTFKADDVADVQYWIGFQSKIEIDNDDNDDAVDADKLKAISPGDLFSTDGRTTHVEAAPRGETAKPWIPNNGGTA